MVLGHLGVTEEEVGVPYTGRVVHAKVHLTKKIRVPISTLGLEYLEAPRPVEKFQDGNLEESDQEGKVLTNNPPWHL